jgi:hypothetical protein
VNNLISKIEKEISKYKRRYEMNRGMSIELDMMYLSAIRNLEDMLITEILEQELRSFGNEDV